MYVYMYISINLYLYVHTYIHMNMLYTHHVMTGKYVYTQFILASTHTNKDTSTCIYIQT